MSNLICKNDELIRTESFPSWPFFDDDERAAVAHVLQSGKVNYWTGEEGRLFEKEFAVGLGVEYAVAMMNGTVALEAALMALNVGRGDEVIVTPRSYIASASCAVMLGAKPVFADVDKDSQNITASAIEKVITGRTRAIIAVHLAGWPCDMDEIMSVAKKHDLAVIEDCAQASGAFYKGRPAGSFGDVAAFSFCQDKIMTTGGEGGMVATKSKDLWSKLWSLKDHGKSYDAVYSANDTKPGPSFKWLHESFGTNWRMTEMQAAIGRIQLRKLKGWVERRRHNAEILTQAFINIPAFRVTTPPEDVYHAFYKYYVFLRPEMLKAGWDRERVIVAINELGIPCFTGSCSEMYLEKAFDTDGLRPEKRLPVARELGDTAMMFPVHPTLSEKDMKDMVRAVEIVLSEAGKV
ncbi:MAG: DegT/DnrJ/EryC1/StrS aminotransferase family protein [Candidatus Vecturithrix sp.]|jgi:dTDP-4-amino-4,6-dideoxygalactose transaminase|nr:DegT/DnrJ/EryC1/StrS aminotransferase family protein [Candidatus Vecturithrix sp.]